MQLRFSLAFLNLTIHSSSFFKHYIERYYKPLCVRNRVASEVVSPPRPPPDLTTTQTPVLVATCKQRLMLSVLLGKATKAGKWVINLYSIAVKLWPRLFKHWIPGGGGGLLGLIFAGYVPLASRSPYPIIVYFMANCRPHLSHFWANM